VTFRWLIDTLNQQQAELICQNSSIRRHFLGQPESHWYIPPSSTEAMPGEVSSRALDIMTYQDQLMATGVETCVKRATTRYSCPTIGDKPIRRSSRLSRHRIGQHHQLS